MSDAHDISLRVRSYVAGRPLPILEKIPFAISPMPRRMLAAFIRMGGESSPWAIGWQIGNDQPVLRSVPEARNRIQVSEMVAEFGDALLAHFKDFEHGQPQLWVAGPTHIDMLHFLALRYARARSGDAQLIARLTATGRLAHMLFEASHNPNRSLCMNAPALLRQVMVFPCEPIRQHHLGYLIGLLKSGTFEQRMAAAQEAEKLAISTTLNPDVERKLEPLVSEWNENKTTSAKDPFEKKIHEILGAELQTRLRVLASGIVAIEGLGLATNPGSSQISVASIDALTRHNGYDEGVRAGGATISPETDHDPVTAASNFAGSDLDLIKAETALTHHDSEMRNQLVQAGSGFKGTIVERKTVIQLRSTKREQLCVLASGSCPLRSRKGDRLRCALDTDDVLRWVIESIEPMLTTQRKIVLVSTKAVVAGAPPMKGAKDVVFYAVDDASMKVRAMIKISELNSSEELPGGWLLDELRSGRDPDSVVEKEHFKGESADTAEKLGLDDGSR